MKNIYISTGDIEKHLEQIKKMGFDLSQKLALLSQEIASVFSQIQSCKNIELAHEYFDILDKIQITLALLVHQNDIGIPDKLWKFMSDFDNFEGVKEHYFEKIKNGEYKF